MSTHLAPVAEQTSDAQQIWFAPPQAMHWPFEQIASVAVHLLPAQQGWLAWPHGTHTFLAAQISPVMQSPHGLLPPHESVTLPQRLPAPVRQAIGVGVQAGASGAATAESSLLPLVPPVEGK
jgi:hypothetical protein